MKTLILKRLKETDGYLSGQEICENFGVSRTAVWKAVKQLTEEGYQIEAVRNKGYRLLDCQDVLSQEELETSIRGEFGKTVIYKQKVDSTNVLAKTLAEAGASHGSLVVADTQDAGRGRRGRGWVSPCGAGIWMSLILRPDLPPTKASMLTLVAALAVRDGIRVSTGLTTVIKWPNDIVADGKKLCGILTEMSAELEGIHYIVTGMGINANMMSFPEEIKDVATSVRIQTGHTIRRSEVIAAVMEAFEQYYGNFMRNKGLNGLVDTYNESMANRNKEVRVLDPAGEYTGTALGINEAGELLVRTSDNTVKNVVSGEVSVRGIYGYV